MYPGEIQPPPEKKPFSYRLIWLEFPSICFSSMYGYCSERSSYKGRGESTTRTFNLRCLREKGRKKMSFSQQPCWSSFRPILFVARIWAYTKKHTDTTHTHTLTERKLNSLIHGNWIKQKEIEWERARERRRASERARGEGERASKRAGTRRQERLSLIHFLTMWLAEHTVWTCSLLSMC